MEWLVILLVALLLFGRRLPEVARSVGKSIVEFKKGVRDVQSEVNSATRLDAATTHSLPAANNAPAPQANATPVPAQQKPEDNTQAASGE